MKIIINIYLMQHEVEVSENNLKYAGTIIRGVHVDVELTVN